MPTCGIWWGAHSSSGWTALESMIGRKLAIVHDYTDWTATFPTAQEVQASAQGRILFVGWTAKNYSTGRPAATWSQIASGQQDAQIDREAAALKAFGQPIMVAFQVEPEQPAFAAFGTAADYVAAWQHLHQRFAADGVTNVVWVWDVEGDVYDHGSTYQDWYPGDAYVDWIMWDPYNWYGCSGGPKNWDSFSTIVDPMYTWLTTHSGTPGNGDYVSKPWGLAEFGTVEGAAPTDKQQWLLSAVSTAQASFPRLKALVYFDSDDVTNGRGCNWQVNSSGPSLSGYVTDGQQPYTTDSMVPAAPTIVANPVPVTTKPGTVVTFSAKATGTPPPKVVWQEQLPGGTKWLTMPRQTSPTARILASPIDNGRQYRALFWDPAVPGRVLQVSSGVASLTVG